MNRSTVFFWPLALAVSVTVLPSTGCIAPAVISGVDPEVRQIIAPGATERAAIEPGIAVSGTGEPDAAKPGIAQPGPGERKAPAEPRKFGPTDLVSIEDNGQSSQPPALVAERIPAVEPLRSAETMRPTGHTLPPRVSLGQTPTMTAGEPTAELPTALRIKPLRDISLDITPPTLTSDQQQPIAPPTDFAAEALPQLAAEQPFVRGELAAAGFDWHPSPEGLNFCYQPLYFEEVNAERYGHSFGILQPAVSAVAFYGRIPILPYMAFARPARRCTYHAHWALPGYKIPRWEPQPIVPSVSGAAAETAVIYGLVLLIP
jgi:hypothetical protein